MSQNFTEFYKPWFNGTPVNAVKASINIGAGANGIVTTKSDLVGTEGNSYTIQVVAGVGNNINLSAVLTGTDILVTLGTDGVGALLASKNTAILIASAINALEGVNSIHSGTGADSISASIAKTNFTGGKYATPAMTQGFIRISGTWYIAMKPVDRWTTDGWHSATPTII